VAEGVVEPVAGEAISVREFEVSKDGVSLIALDFSSEVTASEVTLKPSTQWHFSLLARSCIRFFSVAGALTFDVESFSRFVTVGEKPVDGSTGVVRSLADLNLPFFC